MALLEKPYCSFGMPRKFLSIFIFLFASIITYLNFFGIKTDKFNKLIYSKISQINPKLSSEINDVFIKLDIKEQTIKLETSNVKLQIAEEYLYLDKIISKLTICKSQIQKVLTFSRLSTFLSELFTAV